jgi:hypothetical protein
VAILSFSCPERIAPPATLRRAASQSAAGAVHFASVAGSAPGFGPVRLPHSACTTRTRRAPRAQAAPSASAHSPLRIAATNLGPWQRAAPNEQRWISRAPGVECCRRPVVGAHAIGGPTGGVNHAWQVVGGQRESAFTTCAVPQSMLTDRGVPCGEPHFCEMRGCGDAYLPVFAKNLSINPVSVFPARKSGSARILRCSGIVV